MNRVIIDNCIVLRMERGVCIRPIRLAKKLNPNLNINAIPKITYGNRFEDNKILSQLSDGHINFEDLLQYITH